MLADLTCKNVAITLSTDFIEYVTSSLGDAVKVAVKQVLCVYTDAVIVYNQTTTTLLHVAVDWDMAGGDKLQLLILELIELDWEKTIIDPAKLLAAILSLPVSVILAVMLWNNYKITIPCWLWKPNTV